MENTSTHPYLTKIPVIALVALCCNLLWGSAFPCIKIGYGLFNIAADDRATQLLFAGCRFTLAGILTLAIGSVIARRILMPDRTALVSGLKLCTFQTVLQYLFFYMGLAGTTGVKASIITGSNTFFAILVASLIFHQERLTASKLIGCACGFAGVVIVNLANGGLSGGFALTGEGFILLSAISYAFSSVIMKNYSQHTDPVTLSGTQFFFGGLVLIVIGLAMGGRLTTITPAGIALLIYLGALSAIAYSLWGILLKYNPVSRVAIFGFINPVAGVFLSALLLGEDSQAFSWVSLVALILVCAGIWVVNRQGAQPKQN